METIKIINNFFDLNVDLIDSNIKVHLITLRNNFQVEVGGPGCTPCKINAAKSKYKILINNLINQDNSLIN